MNKAILYPFKIETDFRIGYAWSVELSRRLKLKHSLFTTVSSSSAEPFADVYKILAEAQGFYVKNFQLLNLGLRPVKSERNFLDGDFVESFNVLVEKLQPHTIVLQSDLFSNEVMRGIINSGRRVIVLSTKELNKSPITRKDRAQLFVTILQSAALYNIPASFFKTISEDVSLFNSIASYFRKPQH